MSTINTELNKKLLEGLSLGHKSAYETKYNPKLLQTVPRSLNRDTLTIKTPFYGYDLWHMYELSWLNAKGKPEVAVGELVIPAESPFIVESKSLKLYLNSFNQTNFASLEEVRATIEKDLSAVYKCPIKAEIWPLHSCGTQKHFALTNNISDAICLDDLDIEVNEYTLNPALLLGDNPLSTTIVEEALYTNLLKSNCLVTGQPDWGTAVIKYKGPAIKHENLLRYIVSMRGHNEFHEHCVERIFTDIANTFSPDDLEVRAFYTRRGGLDINPIRAMHTPERIAFRLIRQ